LNNLVSVIMSTFNEDLNWVKESIDSILSQSYSKLEFIIVLDNPNNNKLKEFLYDYKRMDRRIKIIENKDNLGLVGSLNKALLQCSGKYIARMDADDISFKNRLSIEKNYLEKNNLDFVFSRMQLIDENGNNLYETPNKELTFIQVKKGLEYGNISNHPTWFSKKEVFDALNGYRNVPYCEDYDFILRSINQGFKIGKVNEVLLKYRVRDTSISRTFSFEQFLNSRGLLSLYNKKRLDDIFQIEQLIHFSKSLINSKEKEKYIIADRDYRDGIFLLKSKKSFKGIIKVLKSCVTSKYLLSKCLNNIKYKILQN
jgi:glycosyltransferase involved in cell wall biosynthesis